jgi:hypothetical protein
VRALRVQGLRPLVRKACLAAGFEDTDTAEKAIRGSALLPTNSAEAAILAKLSGVPRTTVLSWVAHAKAQADEIQRERLELLGPPGNVIVFVAPDGCVCCDRSEAVEAAAR